MNETKGSDLVWTSWSRPVRRSTRWTRSWPPCLNGGCGRWCRWRATSRPHGLPIHDPAREEQVLQKAADRIQDPALRPYYLDHVRNRMEVARQYEALLLGRNRVAYQGVEGAFAHIALRQLFPPRRGGQLPHLGRGCSPGSRRGMRPGAWCPLRTAMPGMFRRCWTCATATPSCGWCRCTTCRCIRTCWCSPAPPLTAVRHVYSHQQAIAQSETFLKQMQLPCTAMANTAMAAKYVAESGDPSRAAIASRETAALYGLEVLVPDINADGDNTTRFIVISKERPAKGNRFSLLFTVDNKPGKLAEVIQKIGASGFNMESIKSRPMPHVPFEYYFYAELVGDPARAESEALLRELDRTCRTVRMLGVYTK